MSIKSLLCGLILCASATLGWAAQWTFSTSARLSDLAPRINIGAFYFDEWTDYDKLDNISYDYAQRLRNALNEPDSVAGKALLEAIAARQSTDWIGNMDTISNVSDNLELVLPTQNKCSYIIKIRANGDFDLYTTFADLTVNPIYTRFGIVYRTTFQKDAAGNYQAIQSYSGTATITYYDSKHGQNQRSFNTDDFNSYEKNNQ